MKTTMTLPAAPAPIRGSNPIVRALRAPLEARTWLETFHLLFNMPVGLATFVIVVTGLATGVGLLITLLGIPVLFATMYLSRAMGAVERARAKVFLNVDVPAPYRADPPADRWWRVHVGRFTDPATWIEIGYHLLLLPFGTFTFALVFSLWTTAVASLSVPLWVWAVPAADIGLPGDWRLIDADTAAGQAIISLLGLLLLLATPWIVRGLATANAYLVRGMLGTDVFAQVRRLTQNRAAAVDLAAEDRRRIERDLHDGVQQRLVALAMDLGRAKEKLETEPERAMALVTEAHEEAKRAISEVRNLARGIYPAVLTDRGLDAALSSLASRAAIPVQISTDLPRRPPASAEAAAYFTVSEALANVAKHARASRSQVTVRLVSDGWLTIEVRDDGGGGADPSGPGLSGLRDRVRALDGELKVVSPAGGPTVIVAEIPCAS